MILVVLATTIEKGFYSVENKKDLRCVMVYNAFATTPTGGMYPCCRGWNKNLYHDKPKNYFNSIWLDDMKEKMKNGVWPEICTKCKYQENNGILSKRQRRNEEWIRSKKTLDEMENYSHRTRVDLRLSNTCNLACVMCDGRSSSKIIDETKIHYDIVPTHYKESYDENKHKNLKEPYSDEYIDQMIDLISPTSEVYITGGEPSVIKRVPTILKKLIDKGYNKTISLQFNSNFQAFNQEWVNLLSNFQGLMMPSIDGVGQVAEYIRYPCSWNRVNNNIKQFLIQVPHYNTRIFITSSILNVFNLKEIVKWFFEELKPIVKHSNNLTLSVENYLTTPGYFNMYLLPTSAKEKICNDIDFILNTYPIEDYWKKEFYQIKKYIFVPNPRKFTFDETITTLEQFDKMRNTSWKRVFPELNFYYQEYKNAK